MAISAGKKFYLSDEQSDVVFLVGPDEQHYVRFPAHKLIMSSLSEVFAVMLSDRFKEGESGRVNITDITPAAFRNLLQIAYNGKFESPTAAACEEILYAADKYLIPDLPKFCFAHLEKMTINLDNFWNFLNIMCTYYSESMPAKIVIDTLRFLDENANIILESEEFKHLKTDAVVKIIKRSALKGVTEYKILYRVFQWAKFECCRQNLDVTEENESQVLSNIKYDIRYSLIPMDILLGDTKINIFLTQNERQIMLKHSLQMSTSSDLLAPWNNTMLMVPRGLSSKINVMFKSAGTHLPQKNVSTIQFLLIVSIDCVLEALEVNVSLFDVTSTASGDITDLSGKIYDTWICPSNIKPAPTMDKRVITGVMTIGKSICLQKHKAYKLSLVCVRGQFEKMYNDRGFHILASGKEHLLLVDFPNDAATLDNLKSSKFCETIMSRDSTVTYFYDSNQNQFVKSISIIM